MSNHFNDNKTLRVIRANTPEALSSIVRNINAPLQILGFGNDVGGYFLYYRTTTGMERRVVMEVERQRESRGGEASSEVSGKDAVSDEEVS